MVYLFGRKRVLKVCSLISSQRPIQLELSTYGKRLYLHFISLLLIEIEVEMDISWMLYFLEMLCISLN